MKKGFQVLAQCAQQYEDGREEWKDHGHWRAITIKGVDILYALNEKRLACIWEALKRLPPNEEYKIPKMAQECTQWGFPTEEIELRTRQIEKETQQEGSMTAKTGKQVTPK